MTEWQSAAVAWYLQQQRIFADPLNRCKKVALQGNICAFLPSKQHTVLKKKCKTINVTHKYTPSPIKHLMNERLGIQPDKKKRDTHKALNIQNIFKLNVYAIVEIYIGIAENTWQANFLFLFQCLFTPKDLT